MQTPETTETKLYPIGKPGQMATYQHESEDSLTKTVVKTLTLTIGLNDLFPHRVKYLGHTYRLAHISDSDASDELPDTQLLSLRPDTLIGPPSNTRQKDETRRYDMSDYELIPLTETDYDEMITAGINCVRVDAEQVEWVKNRDVFYWGIDAPTLGYPECLYRSNYLGPAIFMDEPAVCTRDHVLRPKLEANPAFRKALTPQIAFEAFQDYFHTAKYDGAPTRICKGLASDPDIDLGGMEFLQQNQYTWETITVPGKRL